MMKKDRGLKIIQFEPLIREIVCSVSNRDYDIVKANYPNSRIDTDDLKRVVAEYGRIIVPLPEEAFSKAEIYKINDGNRLDVYISLWTKEEGRSDLALSLSCCMINGTPTIEINDLRVL
jgi:hypothetical protein